MSRYGEGGEEDFLGRDYGVGGGEEMRGVAPAIDLRLRVHLDAILQLPRPVATK